MSLAPSTPACPPRVLVPEMWSALWLFHSIKGFCQTDDPNSFQKNLTQSVHSGVRSRRQRWESCASSSQCGNGREVHFARTLTNLSTLSLEPYLTDMCCWSIFDSVRIFFFFFFFFFFLIFYFFLWGGLVGLGNKQFLFNIKKEKRKIEKIRRKCL